MTLKTKQNCIFIHGGASNFKFKGWKRKFERFSGDAGERASGTEREATWAALRLTWLFELSLWNRTASVEHVVPNRLRSRALIHPPTRRSEIFDLRLKVLSFKSFFFLVPKRATRGKRSADRNVCETRMIRNQLTSCSRSSVAFCSLVATALNFHVLFFVSFLCDFGFVLYFLLKMKTESIAALQKEIYYAFRVFTTTLWWWLAAGTSQLHNRKVFQW